MFLLADDENTRVVPAELHGQMKRLQADMVVVNHIKACSVQMGHVRVAQASGRCDAVFVVSEFHHSHAGVRVVEAGPHQMNGNVQKGAQPGPAHGGVAEQRDFILIFAQDAVNAVFLSVAQAFEEFAAALLNPRDSFLHTAGAEAVDLIGAVIGQIDSAVFAVVGVLQQGDGLGLSIRKGRQALVLDFMSPVFDLAWKAQKPMGEEKIWLIPASKMRLPTASACRRPRSVRESVT